MNMSRICRAYGLSELENKIAQKLASNENLEGKKVNFSDLLYEQTKIQKYNNTQTTETGKNMVFAALEKVNSLQNDVSRLEKKFVTEPDSINVHDITIAMAKADSALELAHEVIDRIITAWEKITSPVQ